MLTIEQLEKKINLLKIVETSILSFQYITAINPIISLKKNKYVALNFNICLYVVIFEKLRTLCNLLIF